MPKSPDAFRTISEVADWLGIQAHVLRFWESKFAQVKPIKRAGGRRYYRPNDMLLLGGIRQLLHEDGLTIKGVQKILREEGVGHVASLSQPLDEVTQTQIDDTEIAEAPMIESAEPESAVVLNFEAPQETAETAAADAALDEASESDAPELALESPSTETTEPVIEEAVEAAPEVTTEVEPEIELSEVAESAAEVEDIAAPSETAETDPAETEPAPSTSDLPAFLQRPMAEPTETTDNTPAAESAPIQEPPAPKPRIIDIPPMDDISAVPALLTSAYRARHLTTDQARQVKPLLAKLTVLRDSMAGRRPGGMQGGPDA